MMDSDKRLRVYLGAYGQPCIEDKKTGRIYKFSPYIKFHDLRMFAKIIEDFNKGDYE